MRGLGTHMTQRNTHLLERVKEGLLIRVTFHVFGHELAVQVHHACVGRAHLPQFPCGPR